MSEPRIYASDIKDGKYGDFLEFGEEFDPFDFARGFKGIDIEASAEQLSKMLDKSLYHLNVLLIGRIPDQERRGFVVRASREVMATLVLRIICEYEGASRSVRVEASREAVAKKGEISESATWSVIDEYIKHNGGRRPQAKQLDKLVLAKRKELGIKPAHLSSHQIERHLTSWRKANPE